MRENTQKWTKVKAQLKILWQENFIFLLACLVYLMVVFGAAKMYHLEDLFRVNFYFYITSQIAFNSFVILLLGYLLYLVFSPKIKAPLTMMIKHARAYLTDWPYLLHVVLAMLLLPLVVSLFTSFKSMIPGIIPFYLDEAFMQIDQAVHFGFHPWQLTHAVFGDLTSTTALNLVYNFWFFFLWAAIFWHIVFNKDRHHRMQFILSFVLSWFLIGNVLAVIFSSAGPVYYADVTGLADPFIPMMDSLYAMDAILEERGGWLRIFALDTQQDLWALYAASSTGAGAGISAMPSMHLGIAMLMTLSAYRLHKIFGYAMTVNLVITLIGSVHLGWHYAIDGYLSIALAFGIWKMSDWLVKKTF